MKGVRKNKFQFIDMNEKEIIKGECHSIYQIAGGARAKALNKNIDIVIKLKIMITAIRQNYPAIYQK